MYALRERRQHVTQEDFEFAVAKVCENLFQAAELLNRVCATGFEEEPRGKYICQQAVLVDFPVIIYMITFDTV